MLRWITLHPAEDIPPADRLHWQQPLANWNGMCADCHSTGLQRNYSVTDNSFATTYSAVNVSCGSCHGTDPHNNNPVAAGSSTGFAPRYPLPGSAQEPGQAASTPTTVAPSHAQNSKKTLEICAGCHSLRAPLVDGIDPTQPYLDQFSPTLLNPTLYFPDGQIREEVYVWGSFLQSRMHEQGVTCGNCHEPHSQQLKAPDNALCGQCHLTSTYDSATHHRHSVQSAGAQCVNCHMPSRTYMVVDDRRDHSFRVPNPATSAELGAPDPCTDCHQGRNQNWAAAALSDWRRTAQQAPAVAAPGNVDTPANRTLWQRNQAGAALSHAQLRMLSNDPELSELLRASMISRQAQLQADIPVQQLADLLSRKEPLIVLAAVQGSAYLSPTQRENLLGPLLTHNYRAVRIAAANQLRDTETAVQLFAKTDPAADNSPLARALMEADRADDLSSWRGEGAMNKALNSERSGDLSQAIEDYQRTIATDPYFEPAYINLTELYRRQGDTRREQLLYSNALQAIPQSPLLRYSYALHLVRRKNPAQALVQTAKALAIDPASQDNAYLHLLLLDTLGETPKGIAWLRANLRYHQRSIQLLQIGAQQAQKIGDTEALGLFMQRLRASQTPVLR